MQKLNALEMRKDICANGGARDEDKKKQPQWGSRQQILFNVFFEKKIHQNPFQTFVNYKLSIYIKHG